MSKAAYATIDRVKYFASKYRRRSDHKTSLEVYGIDTEADTTGACFMICTSEGDTWIPAEFPACLFTRKYRGKNFVAYNLKYDAGALLQGLSFKNLKTLQSTDQVTAGLYIYKIIANKLLSIRKGKNTVHIYDIAAFFKSSLNQAAKHFIGKEKIDQDTTKYTTAYINKNWGSIAEYCINDAVLTKQLAEALIKMFESFGVYPQKLYSVAYVSYQYFSNTCPYVHVRRYWDKYREVLDYAMQSYNGGKFEVTEKGTGYYYEYDIVSAYPYEISNLVDIRDARIVKSKDYRQDAVYAFLDCDIKIPFDVNSPVALKNRIVNFYPVGEYRKVITLTEYDYLINQGCDITIHNGYWLHKKYLTYPYRTEIRRLAKLKGKYKNSGDKLKYYVIKIFQNSFYGKFVQLIYKDGFYKAGASWNPIYGSVITANCRVRISKMQNEHPEIIAVHTDSIITTSKLDIPISDNLGDLSYETEGEGVILGSGIYQIGNKSRFRGFATKKPLMDMIPSKGKKLDMTKNRPYSWREVAHRGLALTDINRFDDMPRELNINFDSKRIWLDDYNHYGEVLKRNIESVPWYITGTDFKK